MDINIESGLTRMLRLCGGTVFQTALLFMVIVPRLRPGLLSLCSVLASSQTYQQTTKQQDNLFIYFYLLLFYFSTKQLNHETIFYTLFNKYQGKKSNISVPFALY